ncbi:hypothetical protein [Caenispirillum bisanense]|uniref:hypothetical protein n=1 Tax=Caenispirillum bisanense TaxID=414052 RepID=UPI0031E1274C
MSFYLPEASDLMNALYGHMNVFWGEMEGMLVAHKEGKPDIKAQRREKAYGASTQINANSAQIRRLIELAAHPAAAPTGVRS